MDNDFYQNIACSIAGGINYVPFLAKAAIPGFPELTKTSEEFLISGTGFSRSRIENRAFISLLQQANMFVVGYAVEPTLARGAWFVSYRVADSCFAVWREEEDSLSGYYRALASVAKPDLTSCGVSFKLSAEVALAAAEGYGFETTKCNYNGTLVDVLLVEKSPCMFIVSTDTGILLLEKT